MSNLKPRVERYRAGQTPNYASFSTPNSCVPNATSEIKDSAVKQDRRLALLQNSKIENNVRKYTPAQIAVENTLDESVYDQVVQETRPVTKIFLNDMPITKPITDLVTDVESEINNDVLSEEHQKTSDQSKALPAEDLDTPATEEESEEEPDEEHSDSEGADEADQQSEHFTPVFIPKSKRVLSVAQSKDESAIMVDPDKENEIEQLRHQQSLDFAKESLKRILKLDENQSEEMNISDIEDAEDLEQEYELWKIRELKRLERDHEERAMLNKDYAVSRENEVSDSEKTTKNSKFPGIQKLGQRYYHKGAFYKGSLEKFNETHNWLAPTGRDNWFIDPYSETSISRSVLKSASTPGKLGKSKHTHLHEEDTTYAENKFLTKLDRPHAKKDKNNHRVHRDLQ